MGGSDTAPMSEAMIRRMIFLLGAALSGCVATQTPEFATNAEVALRAGQSEDAPVVALLPRGTPLVPVGTIGSDCMCWKVATFAGTGWLNDWFITGPGPGVPSGSGVIPPATAVSRGPFP
jgi:hypothetical protein